MSLLLPMAVLAGIATAASVALAQTPMSPIYPTVHAKPRIAPSDPKETRTAPEPTKVPMAAQSPQADDIPIATAVIPPPVAQEPTVSIEPKKPSNVGSKREESAEPQKTVKHRKGTARRTRYAHRPYAPFLTGWYYSAGAANRGWGGGRFGPSPYSSNGQ